MTFNLSDSLNLSSLKLLNLLFDLQNNETTNKTGTSSIILAISSRFNNNTF